MSGPQLEALLAVQDLDTTIDQHRHRLAALPERAELSAIGAELTHLAVESVAAAAQRDEIVGRQGILEAELSATERRVSEVSRRLYGGEVSASRELQAMAADVEFLGVRASELEDRVLAVMEEREPLDAAVDGFEGRRSALEAQEDQVAERLAASAAEIDAALDELLARRARLAGAVPSALLTTYDRLRARLGGIGAARLIGSRCGGCHLSLAATELDQLRHQPDDTVIYCEQCGRILVH